MKLNDALVQVCVIGMLAFCGPGMFNALNGLGAAGSGDPKVAAVTNGCLYATFAVVGYFAGSIFNVLGPRISFTVGGLSYAVYALCVYYGNVSIWLPGFGGFQLGIGAGIFWCAQMALCIAYATEDNNSKLMSIFWVIFNLGGVFGGFLQMGLNWSLFGAELGGIYTPEGNAASAAGYFSFVAIMCCSPILAWTLLVSPATVVKADGTNPKVKDAEPFIKELKDAAKGFVDPFVLKMLVYFIFSNWFYTYEFGYLNGMFFNSRMAGMNSGLYWGAQMGGAVMVPFVTDKKGWTAKKRAWGGLYLCTGFLCISWILALVIQHTSCNGLVDKDSGTLDYSFPHGGLNKTVAWFPDVCDQYPEIDTLWGGGTCTEGCEFLRYCRITPRSGSNADNEDYYNESGTRMICDIGFPRCANDGEERPIIKMLDDVCEESVDVLDNTLCFNSVNNSVSGAFAVEDFSGEKEHERCMLDMVTGTQPVCSTLRYGTINSVNYRTNIASAEDMCLAIDEIPTSKVLPVKQTDMDDIIVSDTTKYSDVGLDIWGSTDSDAELEANKVELCGVFNTICDWNAGSTSCTLRDEDEDDQLDLETEWSKLGLNYVCMPMDLNFSSQSALIVVDYMLMGISDAIFQVYVLWLIGAMAGGELSLAARYSAAYKGIQSAGAAVAWLTDLIDGFTYKIQAYVCVVFAFCAMVGVAFTIPMFSESLLARDALREAVVDAVRGSGSKELEASVSSSSSSSSSEEK